MSNRLSRGGTGWRPLLRMALRNLVRHRRRSLLISLLIGLPVAAGVAVDTLYLTDQPPPAAAVRELMGTADAVITDAGVTKIAHIDMASQVMSYSDARGARGRDPLTTDDVQALVPAGSTLARPCVTSSPGASSTTLLLRADDRAVSSWASVCPAGNRVGAAQVKIRAGRLPSTPNEIAVSSAAAERLHLPDVADHPTVTTGSHDLTVVGIVDNPASTAGLFAWLPDHSPAAASTGGFRSWLLTLPPTLGDDPAELVRVANTLAAHGIWGNYADGILHPGHYPGRHDDLDTGDREALLLGLVCVAFGLVEVVLLVGAALSVGMRRQAHEIGLLAAAGGTGRDIRRMVLAQTLVYAVTGSVLAVPAALLAVWAATPITERIAGRDMSTLGLAQWHWAGIAGVGVISGLIAGLLPAWRTSRLPVVDALAGRLDSGRIAVPMPWKRLALLAVCVVAALVSGGWLTAALHAGAPASNDTAIPMPFYLLLGSTGAAVLCVAALMNPLLGLLGQRVRGLPVTARFAIRDTARQRSRTGPAAAAVTVSVAAALGVSFMLAGTDAQNRAAYRPWLPMGDVMVYAPEGGAPGAVQDVADAARSVLPGAHVLPMYDVTVPTATKAGGEKYYEMPAIVRLPSRRLDQRVVLQVVSTRLVRQLFGTRAPMVVRALSDGAVFVGQPGRTGKARGLTAVGLLPVDAGHVHLDRATHRVADPVRMRLPVTAVTPPAGNSLLDSGATLLVSRQNAVAAGLRVVPATWALIVPATPLDQSAADEVTAAVEQVGGHAHAELGYRSQFPAMMLLGAGVAGFLAIAATLVSLALAQAEARADLATLAAVGASPGRRRAIAFWQALTIAVVGGLSGTVLGGFVAYASRAFTGRVAIPWTPVLLVVVALPLVAAGISALFTRANLPMVQRLS